jgi:hypothetical protein
MDLGDLHHKFNSTNSYSNEAVLGVYVTLKTDTNQERLP